MPDVAFHLILHVRYNVHVYIDNKMHSVLWHGILFYCTVFYCTVFYSVRFYSIVMYFIPDCREEQYPCTRLYSVHQPCKQCLNSLCFYRSVYNLRFRQSVYTQWQRWDQVTNLQVASKSQVVSVKSESSHKFRHI